MMFYRSAIRSVYRALFALLFVMAETKGLVSAQVSFSVAPTSINFGNETVGIITAARSITVTNTGATSLTISSYSSTPPEFQFLYGRSPVTLAPGARATFAFRFAPDAAQVFAGSFTLNITGVAPFIVPMTGSGVSTGAVAKVSPNSLTFGSQAAGSTSAPQTVTVTNMGTTKMTVQSVTVEPPFLVSGFTNFTQLGPGKSLTFQVSMFGSQPGYFADSATVAYNVRVPSGIGLAGTVTPSTTLAITSFPTLPSATVTSPYLANLTANGGVPPYTWSLVAGSSLPTGLSLQNSGAITGTLGSTVIAGKYPFSILVQDSSVPAQTATATFMLPVTAQTGANCSYITSYVGKTTNPLVALNDLGSGSYLGYQGGLYPNGNNVRPPAHDAAGVAIAAGIQPLDASGNPDPNGKYALMSVGSSAGFDTWLQFMQDALADPATNPHLVFVAGAQPLAYAKDLADANSPFWNPIFQNFLPQAGVTANQVVAVWFQNVDGQVSGTFPKDMLPMQSEYESIARNLHTKFPNLKLMYMGSKIYGGYSNGFKNCPEPDAYETGFAVKWAIQDQINGLPSLNYDANLGPVMAPWMSWASYDWANGLLARSDGLTWACPDSTGDACHPSNPVGREKESNLMLNFFKTDDTTTPWFLTH